MVGTEIELFSRIADLAAEIAEEATESDNKHKKDDAAGSDLDDCSLGSFAARFLHWAVRFGDLVEVFKTIHKSIVPYKRKKPLNPYYSINGKIFLI